MNLGDSCPTMNSLKKRRVRPEAGGGPAGEAAAGLWSPRDKACLQRTIDPLHNGFGMQPLGFLKSEGSTMLCVPPAEVYERLTSMLSSASVVSGLVLSAMAGAALNPLDAADFPGGRRRRVELYNVLAAVTVVTQLCVVLYSTFTLYIVTANAHSPRATSFAPGLLRSQSERSTLESLTLGLARRHGRGQPAHPKARHALVAAKRAAEVIASMECASVDELIASAVDWRQMRA